VSVWKRSFETQERSLETQLQRKRSFCFTSSSHDKFELIYDYHSLRRKIDCCFLLLLVLHPPLEETQRRYDTGTMNPRRYGLRCVTSVGLSVGSSGFLNFVGNRRTFVCRPKTDVSGFHRRRKIGVCQFAKSTNQFASEGRMSQTTDDCAQNSATGPSSLASCFSRSSPNDLLFDKIIIIIDRKLVALLDNLRAWYIVVTLMP
jgi:hypothetical protein